MSQELVYFKDLSTEKQTPRSISKKGWDSIKGGTFGSGRNLSSKYKKLTPAETKKFLASTDEKETVTFTKTSDAVKDAQTLLRKGLKKGVITRDGTEISLKVEGEDEPFVIDTKEAETDEDFLGKLTKAIEDCKNC